MQALIILSIPSLVIPCWIIKAKRIEQEVDLISRNLNQQVLSQIGQTAQLLSPLNSSATNLARFFSSSLDGANLSFPSIETDVRTSL